MATYAYLRVSTKAQRLDRQLKNIHDYCVREKIELLEENVYCEKYTGGEIQGRDELDKLIKKVKSGDMILFDSVSRMSRNASEGLELYKKWFDMDVNLVFLNEPMCNTEFYKSQISRQIDLHVESGKKSVDNFANGTIKLINELLLDLALEQIELCFLQAEKELMDIRSRVKSGLNAKIEKMVEETGDENYHFGNHKGDKLTTKKSILAKQLILFLSSSFDGKRNDKDTLNLINCILSSDNKSIRERFEKKYNLEIPKGFKLSRNTYYLYKRQLVAERQLEIVSEED